MLSQEEMNIIKATVPALRAKGLDITKRMYGIMFTRYPEIKPQFSAEDQENGKQPERLASSILAYASNIDKLENLSGAVEQIAQRHVQTQVTAEQYPIVAECLLEAIKDVLGEAATEEIMSAWAAAYGVLAEILIKREAEIYAEEADVA